MPPFGHWLTQPQLNLNLNPECLRVGLGWLYFLLVPCLSHLIKSAKYSVGLILEQN